MTLLVEWLCSLAIPSITACGPAAQPTRQPVIDHALLRPLIITVRSRIASPNVATLTNRRPS